MSDYIIGLTGGIASGKSALEKSFLSLGVTVADADRVARAIVEPGQPALAAVTDHFGTALLDHEGRLDRAALRARIFGNDEERRTLQGILHPIIRQRLRAECQAAPGPYSVAMIPLLVEGGGRSAYPWLDRILVVDAPRSLQKSRLMQRDGIDGDLAERMLTAQASRTERLALADDIVVNDGEPTCLRAAVDALDTVYRALARAAQS